MSAPIDQPDYQNPQTGLEITAPVQATITVANGATIGPYDLSAYSAIALWSTTALAGGHDWTVMDPDSNFALARLTAPSDALGNVLPLTVLPVRSQRLQVTNNSGAAANITIVATSRKGLPGGPMFAATRADVFSISGTPIASGVLGYPLGHGLASMCVRWTGATATGVINMVTKEGTIHFADSSEAHAGPTGDREMYRQVCIPGNTCRLELGVVTAANATVIVALYYQGEG